MSKGLRGKVEGMLRRRGMFGSIRHPLALVLNLLKHPLGPGREHQWEEALSAQFDREHGVDTDGTIPPEELHGGSGNVAFAAPYQAVLPEPFFQVLKQLPIDYERSVFVDFGSGKGRACLLASELPFQRVVGVEFSPRLQRVAEANWQNFRSTNRQRPPVEWLCQDATAYAIPPGPAVFFFFNPFGEEVMTRVAGNVARSLREAPRKVFVVYFNPQVGHVWQGVPALEAYRVAPLSPPYARPARSPAYGGKAVAVWVTKGYAGQAELAPESSC